MSEHCPSVVCVWRSTDGQYIDVLLASFTELCLRLISRLNELARETSWNDWTTESRAEISLSSIFDLYSALSDKFVLMVLSRLPKRQLWDSCLLQPSVGCSAKSAKCQLTAGVVKVHSRLRREIANEGVARYRYKNSVNELYAASLCSCSCQVCYEPSEILA